MTEIIDIKGRWDFDINIYLEVLKERFGSLEKIETDTYRCSKGTFKVYSKSFRPENPDYEIRIHYTEPAS